jgi:hypothetical protein
MTKAENKLKESAEVIQDICLLASAKPHLKEHYKRIIQVKAWDSANTNIFWSGKITEAALLVPKKERCKEHEYGTTALALDILALENPTIEEIIKELKTKLVWNWTTREENMILRNNDQDYSKISKLVEYTK